MEGRGRPSYYHIGEGEPGMLRERGRRGAEPPYERPSGSRHSSVPPRNPVVGSGVAFSPMSNLSGAVHPTGSPVVGSPTAMGTPIPAMASPMSPPGLVPPPPAAVDPVAVQAALGSQLLVQTVQQQQQQISQMMSLVQQLVQDRTSAEKKGKGGGSLSSISDSVDHAMEVDDGNGAPIRNPKADSYVPKLPMLDGGRMNKGRRAEIEAWVKYLEVFLPWIALFDDRIPSEVQACFVKDKPILNKDLAKGESIRSTRVFLYLRQSFANFSRGLDILKQVEREQLGFRQAMRR